MQTTPDPLLIQPTTAGEVAAALRAAADARQSIVIRGADTKRDWGRPAGRIDRVLDMRRMNRILAHAHGDMTATVEAGATLRDVNEALAVHGQTLPLDPPFADRATIGGLLATNDSGPLRHRYGTPRDLVIGVQLATTDGLLSKAGGQVVKNVAGYDLSKLVTGSFGSLAAIVSATFKLAPLPAASKTMRIAVGDAAAAGEAVRVMMSSQLEPVAFEIMLGTPWPQSQDLWAGVACCAFLIRFASLPAVVDAQIEQALAGLKPCATEIELFDGDAERALWRTHAAAVWDRPGAIVRASWLPADIAAVLKETAGLTEAAGLKPCATSTPAGVPQGSGDVAPGSGDVAQGSSDVAQGFSPAFIGRAAIGAGLIRIDGETAAQADVIGRLRASSPLGNVVIVRGSTDLKARADVWGSHGDRQALFDALKRTFDPHGVLNAGRGPL